MNILVLGVALWVAAHLFKRMAPQFRAAMGDTGKAVVALALLAAVLLMIWGYRSADGAVFWGVSPALKGINNLLILIAFYLFAAAGMKTAIARRMRHPMLWGVVIWSVAHLMVNGDTPSFVLFGGLGLWALVEMAVINRSQPHWVPPAAQPRQRELMALAGAFIVYGVAALVHIWLGYNPFGA
ncbi:NnrU family protein [Paracoccus jiaweipingae]|uniref:NnrU family protein n=1 Tax=unclassified Paracoccus (in: a-proteobacteria) TaxID=2688777 RepID=UPI0037BDB198